MRPLWIGALTLVVLAALVSIGVAGVISEVAERKIRRGEELKQERLEVENAPKVVDLTEITESERLEFLAAGYRGVPTDNSDEILYHPDHRPDSTSKAEKAAYANMEVREVVVCDLTSPFFGQTHYFNSHTRIEVNECLIRYMGADVESTWAHERAHAKGWGHYEGDPSRNAAYWPSQDLGGG